MIMKIDKNNWFVWISAVYASTVIIFAASMAVKMCMFAMSDEMVWSGNDFQDFVLTGIVFAAVVASALWNCVMCVAIAQGGIKK